MRREGSFGYRRHPAKDLSIVATCTTAEDAGMAHCRPGECCELACRMAGLARRTGRQVIHRLGHRRHSGKGLAGVAACATADDAGVNHQRPGERGELGRRVAGLARRAGRQMVHRLGHRRHPGKDLTIVAACAAAEDAGVDHRRTGERGELARRVAGLARRAGRQMVHRLGHRRHPGKALAAVAARAAADDARVAHHPRIRTK